METMIYDCFMFAGEMDMLEIRLNILYKYVDRFVICESKITFSGKEKLRYFQESNKFNEWRHKIIVVEPPVKETSNAFEQAAYQKDYIRIALNSIRIDPEDIIIYGDIDEIPNIELLKKLS